MKRSPPQKRSGVRSSDPFSNLSNEQLIYIGAIAMLYNDVEDRVNELCSEGLRIPIQPQEVLSRINGIEGKISLIKFAAAHWGFEKAEQEHLADALGDGGFMMLKRWRDGVVHARVWDSRTAVARVNEKQGRVSEVLLSIEALRGLYERLNWLNVELFSLLDILVRRSRLARGGIDAQHRERLERENREAWVQARERRKGRLSLPPMPEFPASMSLPGWPEEAQ